MQNSSQYKQVRLTLTEQRDLEAPGLVVVGLRVWVKPQNVEWHAKHVVLVDERRGMSPLSDMDAVYQTLLEFLAAPPLPGHIG